MCISVKYRGKKITWIKLVSGTHKQHESLITIVHNLFWFEPLTKFEVFINYKL